MKVLKSPAVLILVGALIFLNYSTHFLGEVMAD